MKHEIDVLLVVDHENIIKCHEVFEDPLNVQFIFDLIEGGDLLDYLINCPNNRIPENRAVDFFYQILQALHYLHSRNIVHRDIKPENILMFHEDNKIKLKLIDFGFSTVIKNGKLDDCVGSPQYIPPEMLEFQKYDTKVDMWAAGIVLYNMFTGTQPFSAKGNEDELRNNILYHDVVYNLALFKNQDVVSLCKGLLEKDQEKRFSAGNAKLSTWIQNFETSYVNPTVPADFIPSSQMVNDILVLLNKQTNAKNQVWELLLSDLDTDASLEIQNEMLKSAPLIKDKLLGKDVVTYETLLTYMINKKEVKIELSEKLQGICFFK